MQLTLSRYLNLVYFHIVEYMPMDKRRDVDRKLGLIVVDPNGPPIWWQGDNEAAESGLAVARALGMHIPVMN